MPDEKKAMKVQLRKYQSIVNASLLHVFGKTEASASLTVEAAMYSLVAGGKRMRPVFMLAVSDMLYVPHTDIMPFVRAIELIHTYSLIHDDLPCMDNDDTRRGLPTCHIKYSEPIALLAGDALLNRAYEIMIDTCQDGNSSKWKAAKYLSQMAGVNGMIGGQTLDLISEGVKIPYEKLAKMHALKTGCLIRAAIVLPVFFRTTSDSDAHLEKQLQNFADHIGLGFQIKDDILDVTSTKEILGKSVGKDAAEDKSTYVTLFGMEKAQQLLEDEMRFAHEELIQIRSNGYDTGFLENLSHYLLLRNE
jgi:geranylgeranyl diphosphate synthase type II